MFTLKKAYIEAKWFGHITADDVVTAAKVYLELIRKHPNPKLLNDKTAVSGDWEEANDWLEYEWLPQAMKAGLKCFAHVYSHNLFSRLSARDLYLRIIPNIQMENFLSRRNAKQWLKNCNVDAKPNEPTVIF
ncbi:hypothetical protein K0O23_17565 [Pontibacter aydingkolensis]|uniref:SpoIIAA-like n=2 Tax=Pontibacter aydingkolensis TaxID=1911536 RepID=A0ABS7CYF0_9BACT|nr:hypothetical protein [Pontibacter aydingkolensis]